MYPLLVKDRLQLPYAALSVVLVVVCQVLPAASWLRLLHWLCNAAALALHGIHAFLPPPQRYPDAWTLLITGSSCAYFILVFAAVTVAQLLGTFDRGRGSAERAREKEA